MHIKGIVLPNSRQLFRASFPALQVPSATVEWQMTSSYDRHGSEAYVQFAEIIMTVSGRPSLRCRTP
jgi:hypothetical protein